MRNIILLIASLVFYAWGESKYFVLLLLSIYFNYFAGLWLDKFSAVDIPANHRLRKMVLIVYISLEKDHLTGHIRPPSRPETAILPDVKVAC